MQLVSITSDEFRAFAAQSPYCSFMQTPEIAKYRASNGWTTHYLAMKNHGNILAATMLVGKPAFLSYSLFIAPGGPLLDLADQSLATAFLAQLKSYAKAQRGFMLQISPYYELIERDRNGQIVEGGFNHRSALSTLQRLGFCPVAHPSQPQYLFALDIAGKTPDTLFAEFKRNTRGHIRKAEKMGVTVRELNREELSIFKQITESTSQRRHFTDRPLAYYEQMYDLFVPRGEVKFLLAEAAGRPLSVAMFMLYGHEIVYLFSGSDEQYMKEYNAQYLIQWHMIKYAAEHGFERYNFYGIGGLPDPSSKDYGIYDFKKGFGGHVIELAGTFEASLNAPIFTLHHLFSRLRGFVS